jgi:hypothetical protein
MADITWTDGAATDGVTVWNAARETQIRTDITTQVNGNLDADNMANGAISRAKMAAGNQDVVQTIVIPMVDEVILSTRIGFRNTATPKEFYGFTARSAGIILAVDYTADAVQTQSCRFELAIAGTANSSTRVDMTVNANPQTAEVDSLSIAITDGQRIGVYVNAQGGTPTDVVGAFATVYLQRTLV